MNPSDRPPMGYCSVHRKRRVSHDLEEIPEQPGQFRCLAHRVCRALQLSDSVICSVHSRRRNKMQMREVAPGVWECLPQFACRQVTGMASLHQQAQPHTQLPMAPPVNEWGPQQTAPGQNNDITPWSSVMFRGNLAAYSAGASSQDVWCSKHGKRVPKATCERVSGSYYVCRDEAVCVASALKSIEALKGETCTELLCSKHNTLRLLNYLQKTVAGTGYECVANHECRCKAVEAPSAQAAALLMPNYGFSAQLSQTGGQNSTKVASSSTFFAS